MNRYTDTQTRGAVSSILSPGALDGVVFLDAS